MDVGREIRYHWTNTGKAQLQRDSTAKLRQNVLLTYIGICSLRINIYQLRIAKKTYNFKTIVLFFVWLKRVLIECLLLSKGQLGTEEW